MSRHESLVALPSASFDFFPKPKGATATATILARKPIVRTVTTTKPRSRMPASALPSSPTDLHASSSASSSRISSPLTSISSSPLSSPPETPAKKRKSSAVAAPSGQAAKRVRTCKSAGPKKRVKRASPDPPPLSPEPIYRVSRSRSVSHFAPDVNLNARRRWGIDVDGCPNKDFISSQSVVMKLMKSYKAYFEDPRDPDNNKHWLPHPTHPPTIELEYPNANASESFVLLQPKDKDHYNPIFDLEKTLYTIVKYYLTPEQQEPFGPIPDESLSELADRDDDALDDDSSSDTDSLPPSGRSGPSLLRSVQRAIHMHDGPLFVETMQTVNNILRDFKYPVLPDDLIDNPADLPRHTPYKWTDLPKDVLMRVLEENYQRCVGPHVPTLKKYEAFSSTVYGELMPSLSYEIVRLTKLHQDSLFLDLGSGVGQVVVQAALQSGCMGVGVEISEQPAEIAARMRTQFLTRCRMWGLNVGEIEFEHNDMLTSARIDELLPEADVVLVDNKVFAETLNEALRPKFLDLKEGALVVSLKPFVSALNARVTERNVDDISTIFDVTEHRYGSGSVSWGPSGGTYYIHRVDREGYAHIREKFEISRSSSRTSQRRWDSRVS